MTQPPLFQTEQTQHSTRYVPYQAHSETSRAAAEAIAPRLNALERKVLTFIRHRSLDGATDDEGIVSSGLGQTYRPRRIRLTELGYVIDSGERRRTRAGRQAIVWVINTAPPGRRESVVPEKPTESEVVT